MTSMAVVIQERVIKECLGLVSFWGHPQIGTFLIYFSHMFNASL